MKNNIKPLVIFFIVYSILSVVINLLFFEKKIPETLVITAMSGVLATAIIFLLNKIKRD